MEATNMAESTSTVVIRPADLNNDALAILDGAKDFAARVAVNDLLPTSDADFIQALGGIVALPGLEIWVAEFSGKIVGGIGILYAPYIWNPRRQVADELFLWAAQDAPFRTGWLLVDESLKRINAKGAIPMFRALETSPEGLGKLYVRRGLRKAETLYVGA